MSTETIFIVEDDKDILELMRIVVEGEGYTVETFLKTQGVVTSARKNKPAVIIMDLNMGGENTLPILKQLKQGKETSKIPVILASATTGLGEIAHESKADGFLAKPFNINDLVKTVKKFVG